MSRIANFALVVLMALVVASCGGSPIRSSNQTAPEYARANFMHHSLDQLCDVLTWKKGQPACRTAEDRNGKWRNFCSKVAAAGRIELRRRGKPVTYCNNQAVASRSEIQNGGSRSSGRRPDPSSMLACEQYSQLVYNHIMGNRTPPPMKQVVVINQRRPTEYEGEITSCGMFSCTVELRETYRSRWNRKIQETGDSLGQSAYNAGYAIGQAMARSSLRKKAEKQKEEKYQECLRSAGYR